MNGNAAISPWNWPFSWRILILLNISFYNLLGNAFAAGVPPLFGLIIQEFRCTVEEASGLSTFVLLALGLSNIFALPLEALIGKRFTVLASLVVFLATSIWWGEATTFEHVRASRILGGLAGGLIEALGPTIVVETFPPRQLGRAMVIYVAFLAAGSALGPVIAGAIASQLGSWRWYARILSVAIFLNLVACCIMLPETTQIPKGDSDTQSFPGPLDEELRELNRKSEQSMIEDISPRSTNLPSRPSLREAYKLRSWSTHFIRLDWKTAVIRFYQPLELLIAPQVIVTVLVFGLTIGWSVLTSILLSNVFQGPPFLWGPLQIGLFGLAPLTGLTVGLPIGGAFADVLSNRSVRKLSHNPRSRLPAAVFGALVSPGGCLVMGFALQNNLHWIVTAVGYAMLSTGLTGSANVLLTYTVHCFPSRAGHIGVLVNLVKNSLAFGVSYSTMAWYTTMGPAAQYGIMAGLLWFAYLLVVPMWMFSKQLLAAALRWIK